MYGLMNRKIACNKPIRSTGSAVRYYSGMNWYIYIYTYTYYVKFHVKLCNRYASSNDPNIKLGKSYYQLHLTQHA